MKDPLRVRLFERAYRLLAKPVFFRFDPEMVHDQVVMFGRALGRFGIARTVTRKLFSFSDPRLKTVLAGIEFPNPVGLAAGFDKNALLTDILPAVGFGSVELGSVTGQPCQGNPKPRLWRVPNMESLVVYYGLKNDGADIISHRLKDKNLAVPTGISVAKTNNRETTDLDMAIADYAHTTEKFRGIGDYLAINISCPNAFGGTPFTEPELLDKLLSRIDGAADKPVFLKLAVDLTPEQLDSIIDVADAHKISGFICSNLTKDKKKLNLGGMALPGRGGISGRAVQKLSDEQIRYVYSKTKGRYAIIGVGGVFSAEDAYRKIRLGASLVQLITGMIYRGPQLIGQINRGLVDLMERDGFHSVSEIIGVDNRPTL